MLLSSFQSQVYSLKFSVRSFQSQVSSLKFCSVKFQVLSFSSSKSSFVTFSRHLQSSPSVFTFSQVLSYKL